MAFTSVTLTGTLNLGETPQAVADTLVNMTLSSYITDGIIVVFPDTITATCDSNGNFSLTVPANDDSTTSPAGTYYSVVVSDPDNGRVLDDFNVVVSHNYAPSYLLYSIPRMS